MQVLENILLIIMLLVSVLLIIGVVMLPPKSQGMGASFGGEDTTLFGRRRSYGKAAFFEKIVNYSAILFMASAFIYNVVLKFA